MSVSIVSRVAGTDSSATSIQDIPVSATDPTNGQVLTYDSGDGQWEAADPAAAGANTSLSNLVSPTSINAATFRFSAGANQLVSTANNASGASFALSVLSGSGTTSTGAVALASGNASAGASGTLNLATGTGSTNSGAISIVSGAPGTGSSGATTFKSGVAAAGASGTVVLGSGTANTSSGSVFVSSGSASTANSGNANLTTGSAANNSGTISLLTGAGATGDSGGIVLRSGSADAGTSGSVEIETGSGASRGLIYLKDGSEGTAGHVWTSIDTNGAGEWAAAAAGGANTALSNLSSVAVNTALLPDGDATRNLGGVSNRWDNTYTNRLRASDFMQGTSIANTSGGQIVFACQAGISPSLGTAPTGATVVVGMAGGAFGDSVHAFTQSDSAANATASGNIYIESGNKTAGTGNSGTISVTTGISSGGTSGSIDLTTGTASTTRGSVNIDALALTVVGDGIVFPSLASDPTAIAAGHTYFNTGTNKLKVYNGTTWETITSV